MTNTFDKTPLCIACEKKSDDIALYLLKKGADPNINSKDEYGNELTPLMFACKYKRRKMVKALVSKKVDVNVQIGEHSALEIACTNNAYSCFEYLLSHGASLCENYEPDLKTILHVACDTGKLKFVKLLVEKGADINSITTEYMTPLHFACKSGSLNVVSYLISKGADTQVESISSFLSFFFLLKKNYSSRRNLIFYLL